jgi:hypothetical protein
LIGFIAPASAGGLSGEASTLAALTACPSNSDRCRNGARTPTARTATVAAIASATPSSTVRLWLA